MWMDPGKYMQSVMYWLKILITDFSVSVTKKSPLFCNSFGPCQMSRKLAMSSLNFEETKIVLNSA